VQNHLLAGYIEFEGIEENKKVRALIVESSHDYFDICSVAMVGAIRPPRRRMPAGGACRVLPKVPAAVEHYRQIVGRFMWKTWIA